MTLPAIDTAETASLALRMREAPRPYVAGEGARLVADWLATVAADQARAVAALTGRCPAVKAVLEVG